MKYFKKGQTVYDIELGKGVVESIQKSTFPITVKFWTNAYSYYTLNGIRNGNENITLFNHLPEVNNKPIWEPEIGDIVSNYLEGEDWTIGIIVKIKEKTVTVFNKDFYETRIVDCYLSPTTEQYKFVRSSFSGKDIYKLMSNV